MPVEKEKTAATGAPQKPQQLKIAKQSRAEDYFIDYANHVKLEVSNWDVKLIFGQLDAERGVTEQRSAITLPWLAAKLLEFYLQINLKAFEMTSGPISIPKDNIPPELPEPTPDQIAAEPNLPQIFAEMRKIRRQFLGLKDVPTAPPTI